MLKAIKRTKILILIFAVMLSACAALPASSGKGALAEVNLPTRVDVPANAVVSNGVIYCAYNFSVMGVEKMSYSEVLDFCKEKGGTLASIPNATVESAVDKTIQGIGDLEGYYLLGAKGMVDYYTWFNGQMVDFNVLNNSNWYIDYLQLLCLHYSGNSKYPGHSYYGMTEELNLRNTTLTDKNCGFVCEIKGEFCYDSATATVYSGHISPQEKIIKKATCTAGGYLEVVCSTCNAFVSKVNIPATGHFFGEWYTVSGSYLVPPVKKERTCSVCAHVEEYSKNTIWVTILIFLALAGSIFGVINYIRVLKKKK